MNVWETKEIAKYFGVSAPTARKIKRQAIKEHNGTLPYTTGVLVDSVLSIYYTTKQKELDILKGIKR